MAACDTGFMSKGTTCQERGERRRRIRQRDTWEGGGGGNLHIGLKKGNTHYGRTW